MIALSLTLALSTIWPTARGQQELPIPSPLHASGESPPVAIQPPAPAPSDKPLPINLPTALQLGNIRAIDVQVAAERIRLAAAELARAKVLWLPNLQTGADYLRHDGRVQDVVGNIIDTSKSSVMLGVGPTAVFAVTDAIFSPLAARQVVRAREAGLQIAANDTLLAVAEAYFNVEQARGELAGTEDAVRRTADLVRRTESLAPELALPLEVIRARAELARRRQTALAARERWRTASAELVRVLRLDPSALVEPMEPPHLRVTLVSLDRTVEDLIAIGLINRPELAAQRAEVQAALARLRQERLRPFIPSVLLHGASTPPETIGGGVFGGGINERVANFGARMDFDIEVIWELQNLGFGNRARVQERRSENRLSQLELYCCCLDHGKALRTDVKIGIRQGSRVELVKKKRRSQDPGEKQLWEDFTGEEEILLGNPGALTDGQAVRVSNL